MAVGRGDSVLRRVRSGRRAASAEEFPRGQGVESFEMRLEPPARDEIGSLVKGRLGSRGDENLRRPRNFEESPKEGVGRRAGMQIVKGHDAPGEVSAHYRDRLGRIVGGPRDDGLQTSTTLAC